MASQFMHNELKSFFKNPLRRRGEAREMYKGISAIELKKSELRSLERYLAPLQENVLRRKMIYS